MFKYFTSTNIFEGERGVAAARVQDSAQDICHYVLRAAVAAALSLRVVKHRAVKLDTVLQAEQLPAW